MTPCEITGWVRSSDVRLQPPAPGGIPGEMAFHDATLVLDAGHGIRAPGAVGPTGLIPTILADAEVEEIRTARNNPRLALDGALERILAEVAEAVA